MRPARAARPVVAAAVAVAAAWVVAGPVAAACPAPTFSISPNQGRPNDAIRIAGSNWFRTCPDDPNAPRTPDEGIRIVFVQGTSSTLIGTARAGSDGQIAGEVFVPARATTGAAEVRAEGTNGQPSAPFTVTEGAAPTTTTARPTTSTTGATTTTVRGASTTSTTEAEAEDTTTTVDVTTTLPEPDDVVDDDDEVAAAADDDEGTRPAVLLAVGSLALAAGAAVSFLLYRIRKGPVEGI